MLRSPLFYGIATFIFCLVLFGIVLPAVTCIDGWESISIGSQGACSHHGGVNTFPNAIAMVISFTVGFFCMVKSKQEERKPCRPRQ